MRTNIYKKFEELLAKIKDMIARYPNIGWRCEKTIFNYCGGDVLKVDFYFRDIRYFDNNVKIGISITVSTTTDDINTFVFRCEELIMAQFGFEKRNILFNFDVASLYPRVIPDKHNHDRIDALRYVLKDAKERDKLYLNEKWREIRQQKRENKIPEITRVIFNKPATIVFWADGTKTVVKSQGKEKYDKEKGLAMAISKKVLGNEGSYYDTFKKFLD